MINEKIRDYIREMNEEAVLFDSPAFDNSIIGLTDNGCVIYDYDSMCEELAEEDNISIEEAAEFIDYNTLRSLPYVHSLTGSTCTPVILDSTSRDEIEYIKNTKEED